MERDAFQTFYMSQSDAIFKYIFFMVNNKEQAEDFTQETFFKAYKQFETFRHEAAAHTWLKRIARNLVYDHYRKKRLIKFLPLGHKKDYADDTQTPSEVLETGENMAILYEALKKLKLSYRETVILRKIEGLTVKEAAQFLQCSEAKVKNNTFRAMAALKKILQEGGHSDESFR
ncbi:RNA polymerase sigma factor [Viridibacillus sp. YIM B01967]|uniref:RNA polymerase sigma factor n=1 Tax=Viridibacillus soli TaxID=2798301 RepID=A0ABS1H778_9BACL|nr:RNA polymerase sigma factor [Viridibacillus soli]MBK3495275.1 RNA polymerase sigma factor [Viridibacillus soli]